MVCSFQVDVLGLGKSYVTDKGIDPADTCAQTAQMAGYSSHTLEAFVDTVRLKSFSSVARKRGLTASSVARQISSLEEEFGVALFIRTTRSLVLTEVGQLLFKRSEQILDQLDAAKREAASLRKEVRGCLRLCCWPTFGKRCVLPHLPELVERYPDLRIDLDLTERLHEPALDRTDLVIRIGELADSSLLAIRLATQHSVIAASPAYLAKHGTPRSVAECTRHRLINKRHIAPFMGWRTLLGESRAVLQQLVLQSDDLQAQADACATDLGLVYLPAWVLQDRLDSGEIKSLTFEETDVRRLVSVHLLRNPGAPTKTIEVFCTYLREKISDKGWSR